MWFINLLMNAFAAIVILFSLMYLYFQHKYSHWSRQNIPYLKPEFPYGNTKSLVRLQKCFAECFVDIYQDMKKITKSYGGIYMFSRPSLMIIDLELIRTILTKDFNSFQNRGMFSDEEANPLGSNLITLCGQKWKNLRTKLTPAFSSAKMKMMFQIMHECSKELNNIVNEHIKNGKSVDTREVLARLTTDTIGSTAFGINCNSLRNPDAEFRKYGKKVFEINPRTIIVNILATNFPSLLKILKISQIAPDVTEFFMNALKQTIDYRQKNNVQRNDFLDLLIRLKEKKSIENEENSTITTEGITFNELAAQSFAFFAAGFETSSSTLNFCLFELVRNMEVQDKLRTEIVAKLKETNGNLTYEMIAEMKYLDKVICEVLRKYPPIPTLQRECTKDYKIPNSTYIIKKGTKLVIPSMGMHMDEKYFPNPNQFDPERFSDEEKKKRHPYTYLPFGEGPRICIGMRFAQLQIKIALTNLLKDYKFTLDPATKLPLEFNPKSIFLSPKNVILLKAERL